MTLSRLKRQAAVSAALYTATLLSVVFVDARPLTADLLVLKQGGRLEGNIQLKGKDATAFYVVRTEDGLQLAIPAYDVAKYYPDNELMQEYRKRAAQAGQDPAAHWELSRWCNGNGLPEQSRRHIERVVELDPDNGVARAALDQAKFNGEWIPKDQLKRTQGLIFRGGKWVVPESAALNEQQDKEAAAMRIWKTTIQKHRKDCLSPRNRAKAMAELRAIQDPLAARALSELVLDKKETLEFRELYLELLSQWDDSYTINALVALGLVDEPRLRERALDLVKEKAPRFAAGIYSRLLHDKNNGMVRRAALALSHVPQPETMLDLINALVTTHTEVINPNSGNMNPTFNSDGSGGMNMGGKPQKVDRTLENREVLAALLSLEPGVNFQFDEDSWRTWYAQRAVYNYNLRRDP